MALVSVLLGAATTIGLAWQIARNAPTFAQSISPPRWSHADGASWLYREQSSFGATRIRGQRTNAVGGRPATLTIVRPPHWSALAHQALPPNWTTAMWEEAYGWPRRALMVRVDGSMGLPVRVVGGIDLGPHPREWGSRSYLPTLPIWPGIAINSLSFALVWWFILLLLAITARMLIRLPMTLRLRGGRCPQCGYDLRAKFDQGCSECGWRRATGA